MYCNRQSAFPLCFPRALPASASALQIAAAMSASKPGATTRSLQLLQELAGEGVAVCFANPGTTEMWLVSALDALSDHQLHLSQGAAMRAVLCLHETVAAGAADGYARMARLPASVLLHLGPGLANSLSQLHNARRAGSPVLCLVGGMATWHDSADPVLAMDIQSLAATVSCAVATLVGSPEEHTQTTRELMRTQQGAHQQLTSPPGALRWHVVEALPSSRVITLVIPHDLSWEPSSCEFNTLPETPPNPGTACPAGIPLASNGRTHLPPAVLEFTQQCAAAMKAAPRGATALYLGGDALLAADGALHHAGLVAAACGSDLWCENAFARIDRGAGLPHLRRLPYFPEDAVRALSNYKLVVVVDARLPVANFGYRDGPSQLMPEHLLSSDAVWELDPKALQSPGDAVTAAACLQALAQELGATQPIGADLTCGGVFSHVARPTLPADANKLTPDVLCQCIAALQPEGVILVDESLTSGGAYWELSKGCPAFSHLTLTGGAIGSGPPLALGAATACPDRWVINLQADGSALYSTQALWSQAREQARVITIICQNNSYNILKVECAKQRVASAGKATRQLTSLDQPRIDWVQLAQGYGVPATAAATAGQLADGLRQALHGSGPALIVAQL